MRIGKRSSPILNLCLIPIMIGLCGILFSRQFPHPLVRSLIVLFSAAAPLFTMGIATTRLRVTRGPWVLLALGPLMLAVGAGVTIWDLTTSDEITGFLASWSDAPQYIWDISRWMGMFALLGGLVVLLHLAVRREEELGEIHLHFSHLSEHMGEGFLLADAEGSISQVNRSLLDMTGLAKNDLIGKNVLMQGGPLNLEPMFSSMSSHGTVRTTEYRLTLTRQGEDRHFWISGTPIFNQSGELVGTLATFRDITEQERLTRRLERYTLELEELVEERTRRLRVSERQFRDLLMNMNEGFATLNSERRIQFVNDRMCALMHVRPADLAGRDILDFVEPSSQGGLVELLRLAGSPETGPVQHELALLRRDGLTVPVMAAAAPVEPTGENDVCVSLVITDVTAYKRLQREVETRAAELESANERLKLLDRAKDSFLTNVGHELRTPLSTIRGYLEMLESKSLGPLDDTQLHALRVMYRNTDRLGSLIEEMIEFSRMQIRGIELDRNLLDVVRLVEEAAQSIRPQALQRNMIVKAEISHPFPPAWGDRKRLGQVLTILLSNAVKFSHDEGLIEIIVGTRPDRTLVLSVQDHGIGIDPEHHRQVFDKFYQVDSSLARRYEGAGIGLSIAKAIADAHGGHVELVSALGRGSTFTLVLPGALFETAQDQDKTNLVDEDCHVLLIDDQTEPRTILTQALQSLGCSVNAATNTFEGIRLAREAFFSVILLSDAMQDMGSSSAMGRLRGEPALAGVPIVVMTSENADEEDKGDLVAYGATLLARPFTILALAQATRGLEHFETGNVHDHVETPKAAVSTAPPRVVALEHDADLQDWLEMALRRRGILCRCANSFSHAEELLREESVGACLVDLDMPQSDPSDWVTRLRQASGNDSLPVYAMTGMPDSMWKGASLTAILRRPFRIDDIVDTLKTHGVAASSTTIHSH